MAEESINVTHTEGASAMDQEPGAELVIGWQVLFFDLVLWIFVPDEFRVGQYFVTAAAIIGFVLGITLVLAGIHRRRNINRLAGREH